MKIEVVAYTLVALVWIFICALVISVVFWVMP